MAKPKLYGIPGSRAIRSLWAIEEVGVEYEHVSVNFMDESKNAGVSGGESERSYSRLARWRCDPV